MSEPMWAKCALQATKHFNKPFLSLFLFFTLGNATVFAQQQQVRLSSKTLTVQKMMSEIEKQTGFLFVYSDVDLNIHRIVSLAQQNGRLDLFLEQLAKENGLKYELTPNKYVILSKQGETSKVVTKLTGRVTDTKGEPLIGATIVQKGTQNRTITDVDGKFSMDAPVGSTLVVSYIGWRDKELKASKNMSIVLQDDVAALEEVVVVGYGTMKKKNLTGAVSAVSSTTISDSHATHLSTALQGATSGLTVTRNGGAPESNATLQIRGITTLSDTSPLVIIDGVPGDINMVNPDDVENLSVLKDAASAAIYGSRAAAGVVLITTKRAKTDDLQMSYNFEFGFDKPTTMPKYVGWKRFMEMTNELRYNDNPQGGKFQTYTEDLIANYLQNNKTNPDKYPITNWEDVLYNKNVNRQTHTFSLMGGGKKVMSKASFRYDKSDGMYVNRNYERFMTRLNNDFSLNKYIEAHLDANFSYSRLKTPHHNPFDDGGRNIPPIYAVHWQDGRYGDVKDGENMLAKIQAGGVEATNRYAIGGKGELNIKPIEGLKLSLIASPNFRFDNIKSFVKQVPYTNADDPNKVVGYFGGHYVTSLEETRKQGYDITAQALGNYHKTIGLHDISLLLGYEYFYMREEKISGSGSNYELMDYPYLDLAPSDHQKVGGNALEYSYRSYFSRINYSYANKYLLELNLRRDGSSRFNRATRWASFPSLSLGWVVSEENFMKPLRWLNHFKVRLSTGKLGNERIGSYYPYQASIDFGRALMYNAGQTMSITTAAQGKYAVKDITWETTQSWDIGIDARFLNNRLSFTFDYYKKNTKDMLLALQIPIFMGYANPDVNAGKMHTKGFDLDLSWRDKIGELQYNVAFNLSDYKSVMGNMNGTEFVGAQINREGSEFNQWYGYRSKGIYQDQTTLDNSAKLNKNIKVGDVQYEDVSGPNGTADGIISAEYDRFLLKGSLPHFLYGLSLGAAYKGFDFNVSFQGVGEKWNRMTPSMVEGLPGNWLNFPQLIDGQYWSSYNTDEQNKQMKYPRLTRSNADANYSMSDQWLYNGWYLRCKNITLGYSIPKHIVNRFFVKSLRVYVSANDLFSFNNCPKGWDPEVVDAGYPIMRSLMFGLNINF